MNENQGNEGDKQMNPSKELNTNKNLENNIIFKKSYRVPDANNKKGIEKINYYNFIGITKFITFAELIEVLFFNKKFYDAISTIY